MVRVVPIRANSPLEFKMSPRCCGGGCYFKLGLNFYVRSYINGHISYAPGSQRDKKKKEKEDQKLLRCKKKTKTNEYLFFLLKMCQRTHTNTHTYTLIYSISF